MSSNGLNLADIWKCFKKGIKRAWKGKLWKYILGTSISSVAGVFTLVRSFLNDYFKNYRLGPIVLIVGSIVAFLFLIRVTIFFCIEIATLLIERRIKTDPVYGEAIILLKEAFAGIHKLRKSTFKYKDEDFLKALLYMCNNLKTFFDKRTGADCSVAIRVIVEDMPTTKVSGDATVEHLCRDTSSVASRDATDKLKGHTILVNSSFSGIVTAIKKQRKELFYITEDIQDTRNYSNSFYNDPKTAPYKGEFIYPIIPYLPAANDKLGGFICIECSTPYNFDLTYDLALIQGVSDGIYDIITYREETGMTVAHK